MALNHILGKVPMIQVIDFMMGHIEYDISVKEIIEYTGVGPTDMKRDFPGLIESGVVVGTRKVGGVQLYILNNDDAVMDALFELDRVLSGDVSEETAGDEEELDADDSKKYPESKEEWES